MEYTPVKEEDENLFNSQRDQAPTFQLKMPFNDNKIPTELRGLTQETFGQPKISVENTDSMDNSPKEIASKD